MSSPEGDRGGACTTSRVSQFVDDACLKQVTLDDAEETKALREDSVGTTDPRVVLACRRSYPLSAVGALRLALLVSAPRSLSARSVGVFGVANTVQSGLIRASVGTEKRGRTVVSTKSVRNLPKLVRVGS